MPGGASLKVFCPPMALELLLQTAKQDLNSQELETTRALFLLSQAPIQPWEFGQAVSLAQLVSLKQSDWLLEMLTQGKVVSYFQPIVKADNLQEVYGYEALLRGIDDSGRVVSPGPMVDVATEAGLLPVLDRIARQSAIHSAQRVNLPQLGAHVFINFSPTALYEPTACLRETVREIDEAGIDHDRVVFEVVESDQPKDLEHLHKILKYYRNAGFQVAMDDFGAGYSGLNLLHQLHPDLIKLDMELIRNVHQDSYKALITEKILEIAQSLAIETVAEGIESPEEWVWARDHGVTYIQGYFVARPGPYLVCGLPNIHPLS